MDKLILFTGFNKFAIDARIQSIINESQADDLSVAKYDCEEMLIQEVINDCETLPFLSDFKVVIATNPLFLTAEKAKLEHDLSRFEAYVKNPNPATIFIINAFNCKLDKKRNINKLLLSACKVYDFDQITEDEAKALIKSKLKGIFVHPEAALELISRCNCDAFRLHSELDKIVFYLENETELKLNDVKLLVSELPESNIFDLTNSITGRNIPKAMEVYRKLLQFNEEPIVFSAILAKNFHTMYLIKQYQKEYKTENEMASLLKIHPYQLKKLSESARKTSVEEIKASLAALSRYDTSVKTGRIDKYLGFELFILSL